MMSYNLGGYIVVALPIPPVDVSEQ